MNQKYVNDMKKNKYITPGTYVRILHVEQSLLAGLSIVDGTPADGSEVLSKDIDFDDDEGVRGSSGIWED